MAARISGAGLQSETAGDVGADGRTGPHAEHGNRVDANNIQASWKSISRDFLTLFSTIQTKSAETAIDASGMMLAEQGVYITPHALANPNAFAGWAPSGLDIASYFQSPVFAALHAIRTGSSSLEALEYGRNLLVMLTSLAVMDTARQAESLDITSRPKVGYIRVESATCCDRCMILAGKWFRFNEGFLRHPHCHGRHVPAARAWPNSRGGSATLWRVSKVSPVRSRTSASARITRRPSAMAPTSTRSSTRNAACGRWAKAIRR